MLILIFAEQPLPVQKHIKYSYKRNDLVSTNKLMSINSIIKCLLNHAFHYFF